MGKKKNKNRSTKTVKKENSNSLYSLKDILIEKFAETSDKNIGNMLYNNAKASFNSKKINIVESSTKAEERAIQNFKTAINNYNLADISDNNVYISFYFKGVNCENAHILISYRKISLIILLEDSAKHIKQNVYVALVGHLYAIELINELNLEVDKVVSPYLTIMDLLCDLEYTHKDKYNLIAEDFISTYSNSLHTDKFLYNPYMLHELNLEFTNKSYMFSISLEEYLNACVRDEYADVLHEDILKHPPMHLSNSFENLKERAVFNSEYYFKSELEIFDKLPNRHLLSPIFKYKNCIFVSGKSLVGKNIGGGILWNNIGMFVNIQKQRICEDDSTAVILTVLHCFKKIISFDKLAEVKSIFISDENAYNFLTLLNVSELEFDISEEIYLELCEKLVLVHHENNLASIILNFPEDFKFKTSNDVLEHLIDINNKDLCVSRKLPEGHDKLVKLNY